MKKHFLVLIALGLSYGISAQGYTPNPQPTTKPTQSSKTQTPASDEKPCVEVKGVESEQICYGYGEGESYTYYGETISTAARYGFLFKNLNKYPVTIEAELWKQGSSEIVKTKTFIIDAAGKAEAEYTWKAELKYVVYWGGLSGDMKDNPKDYYIKFKAFKCP